MAVIPFRWQGTTRREQMRSAIEARSKDWLEQWSASDAAECRVTLEVSRRAHSVDAEEYWWRARGSKGELCLRMTATIYRDVGCRLVNLPLAEGCDLAAGIGRRAMKDLVLQLVGADAEIEVLPSGDSPATHAIDPKCGVVALTWSLDTDDLDIYVDACLCDTLAPCSVVAAEPLVAREQAILPGKVTLQAVLELGHAALADTVTLKPGEIIKTDMPLDAVVEVRSESGRTVLSGVLAAADGYRALRCMTTTHG